jgi:hypothetical protein
MSPEAMPLAAGFGDGRGVPNQNRLKRYGANRSGEAARKRVLQKTDEKLHLARRAKKFRKALILLAFFTKNRENLF